MPNTFVQLFTSRLTVNEFNGVVNSSRSFQTWPLRQLERHFTRLLCRKFSVTVRCPTNKLLCFLNLLFIAVALLLRKAHRIQSLTMHFELTWLIFCFVGIFVLVLCVLWLPTSVRGQYSMAFEVKSYCEHWMAWKSSRLPFLNIAWPYGKVDAIKVSMLGGCLF